MNFLKAIFGGGTKEDVGTMIKEGALILDVRSPGEYAGGNVNKSLNIPLNKLKSRLHELDKTRPIVTCCASGMRSSSARKLLLAEGFESVANGGSWTSLQGY